LRICARGGIRTTHPTGLQGHWRLVESSGNLRQSVTISDAQRQSVTISDAQRQSAVISGNHADAFLIGTHISGNYGGSCHVSTALRVRDARPAAQVPIKPAQIPSNRHRSHQTGTDPIKLAQIPSSWHRSPSSWHRSHQTGTDPIKPAQIPLHVIWD
jgi:hypothetical protein